MRSFTIVPNDTRVVSDMEGLKDNTHLMKIWIPRALRYIIQYLWSELPQVYRLI